MSRFAFPDQAYARRCLMCGFMSRRNEWDETPALTHCPTCGIELERLSCRSCGAPLLPVREDSFTVMFGGGSSRIGPFCGFCGEPTAPPREKQLRTKPIPKDEDAPHFTVDYGSMLIRYGAHHDPCECKACVEKRAQPETPDEDTDDEDDDA